MPLAPDTRMTLASDLSGLSIPGRLVPPENWHVTLRFLGSVDMVTYDRFLHGLGSLSAVKAFPARLDHLGGFPNPRRATVVWVGVGEGAEQLVGLNQITEEAAQEAGLDAEERPYRPHLTLARVRPPKDIRALTEVELDLGWKCREVVVYRSHLGRGGARYEPLETFPLFR